MIPIRNLSAQAGFVSDKLSWETPPEILDDLINAAPNVISLTNGLGWERIPYPYTPAHVAVGLMEWVDNTATNRTFALGTTNIYEYGALAETSVGRGTPAYSSTDAWPVWTGGILGNVPIANISGGEPPQYYNGTKFTDLPNMTYTYPGHSITKVVGQTCRICGPYVVLLDVTITDNQGGGPVATSYHNMLKWSSSTEPGAVPASWNVADATNDAGEIILGDNSFKLWDVVPFREGFFVYGSEGIWKMTQIGLPYIWGFDKVYSGLGAFCRNCAVNTPIGQVALLAGDVLLHDGFNFKSLVNNRIQGELFEAIRYWPEKVFLTTDYKNSQVLICIPDSTVLGTVTMGGLGSTIAYVWNWVSDTWHKKLLPNVTGAITGYSFVPTVGVIDGAPYTTTIIDTDNDVIDKTDLLPPLKELIGFAAQTGIGPIRMNIGSSANGAEQVATVLKRDLAVIGQDRQGNMVIDPTRTKFLAKINPIISCKGAYTIDCHAAGRFKLDDPVVFKLCRKDTMGVGFACNISGRYISLRFTIRSSEKWTFNGYDLDISPLGGF